MYVNHLELTKEFFIKYFNARASDIYHNKKTGFSSYFLSFGDGPRLEIMNRPDISGNAGKMQAAGYAHIAFPAGSREKVDRLTKRLKADGYEVINGPRITGDGYYESCIAGIKGNQIEITV